MAIQKAGDWNRNAGQDWAIGQSFGSAQDGDSAVGMIDMHFSGPWIEHPDLERTKLQILMNFGLQLFGAVGRRDDFDGEFRRSLKIRISGGSSKPVFA